jgi:hypothetical protein
MISIGRKVADAVYPGGLAWKRGSSLAKAVEHSAGRLRRTLLSTRVRRRPGEKAHTVRLSSSVSDMGRWPGAVGDASRRRSVAGLVRSTFAARAIGSSLGCGGF